MSLFELLDQPFNIVHELYRLVFLKNKAQKEEEERKKLEAEEKARAEQLAHRERLRSNVPAFATKTEVLKQTPPQDKQEKSEPEPVKGENKSTMTNSTNSVVSQMIAGDMQNILEEVIS